MKTWIHIILGVILLPNVFAQKQVTLDSFRHLDNSFWSGNLMYINYSDGKEIHINATLEIILTEDGIVQKMAYPDEPNANYTSDIPFKDNGRFFGDEEVIETKLINNQIVELTTYYKGMDNNKKADIYKTYLFGDTRLTITIVVVYKKTKQKMVRNRYTFTKK